MISNDILEMIFLNKPELIFFTQLSGFTYLYLVQIILFTINYFFFFKLEVGKRSSLTMKLYSLFSRPN